MREHEDQTDELDQLASLLAGLSPAATSVDRQELMFRAGRASAEGVRRQRRAWRWPMATAACALVAATGGFAVGNRHEPVVVERIVTVPAPVESLRARDAPAPLTMARAEPMPREVIEQLKLRRALLTDGIRALPEPRGTTVSRGDLGRSPTSRLDLQRELLAPRSPRELF